MLKTKNAWTNGAQEAPEYYLNHPFDERNHGLAAAAVQGGGHFPVQNVVTDRQVTVV